jgi:hypothetical protein
VVAQYVPETMPTVASAAGTVNHDSRALHTASPQRITPGADTTSTDIAHSSRSTDSARMPERDRADATTAAVISTPIATTATTPTGLNTRHPVATPTTIAVRIKTEGRGLE